MYYKEDQKGQILQEGINEAGAMASWIAAATSYANNGEPMMPFYVFYSMFGFQRIGDLIWAAGDSRSRGFLIGGTAGRTTLNGEGLQHEDGHSHLIAATVPNCVAYDPAYGYEVAVIVQDGLRRMLGEHEDVFYYLTTMNENYPQPAMPEGAREGIVRGDAPGPGSGDRPQVQLLGAGTILREVLAGAELLREDSAIDADVFSVTRFTELRRDGIEVERWNRLHPTDEPRRAYVAEALGEGPGPVVAATDYLRALPELHPPVGARAATRSLGTDGFGRSDYREALRRFFEVDRHHVVVAALHALARRRARRDGREGHRALRDRPGRGGPMAAMKEVTRPRHRGLHRRPGRSRSSSRSATRSRPRSRSSSSSPTRRRWRCPRRSAGTVKEVKVARSATRSPRARCCSLLEVGADRGRRRGAGARRAGAARPRSRVRGRRRRSSARPRTRRPRRAEPPEPVHRGGRRRPTATAPSTPAPSVRRLARERGVDLLGVTGTRPQGPDH